MCLLEKISVIWILYIINTKVLRCSFKGIINFTVDIIVALTLPAETPRPIPCPAELWNDWGEAWVGDLFNCWETIHLWSGTDILRSTHHYWQENQEFSPTSSIKHAPADQGTRLGSLFLRKIVRVPVSALSLQDSAGDCSVGLINQASRQSRTATQIETGQLP